MTSDEKIEVFNVNKPGASTFVQKDKFLEVRRVLLENMPTASPGLNQDEMAELVRSKVSQQIFEDRSKSGWWMKSVQLDLEARGLLVREKTKPTQWYYDPTKPELTLQASGKLEPKPKAVTAMPEAIRSILLENDLMNEYDERPYYQRNDYLAWIVQAQRAETKAKRIAQMLEELKAGNVYMNMDYKKKA